MKQILIFFVAPPKSSTIRFAHLDHDFLVSVTNHRDRDPLP